MSAPADPVDDRARVDRLARLIDSDAAALLAAWRAVIERLPSAARLDRAALDGHVASLLRELASALREKHAPLALSTDGDHAGWASVAHGLQRFGAGWHIEELVADCGALRRCVIERAESDGLSLHGAPLRRLDQWLDTALGQAVRAFAAQQALDARKHREEHLAAIAHDLRGPLQSVSLVTDVLEAAAAQPAGAFDTLRTLPLLRRNVQRLDRLIGSVLSLEQPLDAGPTQARRGSASVELRPLIAKLLDAHALPADANDVPPAVRASGDRWLIEHLLSALIARAAGAGAGAGAGTGTEGMRLRVQGKAAAPGRGVALRLLLVWPVSASAAAAPRTVWLPLGQATRAADADGDAAALKTLIGTQAASVDVETLQDGEALVLTWPEAPPPA